MLPPRRAATALLLAATFGAVVGLFKGVDPGWRADVGNLSAPWLLVAFLPALRCRTTMRGALTGLVSTLVALTAFYAVLAVLLAGHLGGGGYASEYLVEAEANRIYFLAGMVTGPLLGAAGAWIGRHHRAATWMVVGGLLSGEILAVALTSGHRLAPPPLYFEWGVDDWRPYIAESALGLTIMLAALWQRRPTITDV